MRIITLNANGIRSAASKGLFEWLAEAGGGRRLRAGDEGAGAPARRRAVPAAGYHCYYFDAQKKGYSGVAHLFAKRKPDKVMIGYGSASSTPRVATSKRSSASCRRLAVPAVGLVAARIGSAPSSASWRSSCRTCARSSAKRRDYVICGDWNIAHKEIDLRNWRSNQKNSGFLPEERAWLDQLFGDVGYVDALPRGQPQARSVHVVVEPRPGLGEERRLAHRLPDHESQRSRGSVLNASIYKKKRFSDHAPLVMDYDL